MGAVRFEVKLLGFGTLFIQLVGVTSHNTGNFLVWTTQWVLGPGVPCQRGVVYWSAWFPRGEGPGKEDTGRLPFFVAGGTGV
jgi:hypothetical protein